ncbi:MAG: hypothetical protein GX851_00525, partial [Clostridiales bacterium]|nr:hypothetical protein [Clostridiales bacterium]
MKKRIFSIVLMLCVLLLALCLPASSAQGGTFTVTVDAGEHGLVNYGGDRASKMDFALSKNPKKLPDEVKIIPDAGYVPNGFDASLSINQVSAGSSHVMVLGSDGRVYA